MEKLSAANFFYCEACMDIEKPLNGHGQEGEAPVTIDNCRTDDNAPDAIQAAIQSENPTAFPTPNAPANIALQFNGTASEYFRIWIVNLCLTLVTFGIFSAWAKVRKKRYTYSHTTLGGTPFQYLGQPIPILKGRIIAVLGFSIYYLSSNYITSLLPYVLFAGFVAAPSVLTRSAAFNARYSAYRNLTFYFDAGYWDAFKTLYKWGVLPFLGVGMVMLSRGNFRVWIAASVLFGIHFPWWIRRLKDFTVNHTSYGGKSGLFSARGGQFFKIYFISALIILAITVPAGIITVSMISSIKIEWLLPWMVLVPTYVGYVVAFAYVQARSGNLVWNNIRMGPLRFQSTLKVGDLLKLYVTNAIGIVLSLGLLIPWAVIRMQTYRISRLQVVQTNTLYQFKGDRKASVAAFGAETIDIFDMDLSL